MQIIVCITVFCGGVASLRGGEDESVIDQIIADWQRRHAMIQNVRLDAEGKGLIPKEFYLNPEAPDERWPKENHEYIRSLTLMLDFAGNRMRKELQEDRLYRDDDYAVYPLLEVTLYGRRGLQIYEPRDINLRLGNAYRADPLVTELTFLSENSAAIRMNQQSDMPGFLSFSILGRTRNRIRLPIEESTREYFRFHGRGEINGCPQVVLRTIPLSSDWWYEIWVDPVKDSAITRHVTYVSDQELCRSEIDYQMTSDGWLPKHWEFWAYEHPRGSLSHWHSMTVHNCEINTLMSDEDFYIEPPPGMVVFDVATMRHYVQPRSGERARSVAEVRLERSSAATRFYWVVSGTASIVVIFAVWLVWRRVRTRRQLT